MGGGRGGRCAGQWMALASVAQPGAWIAAADAMRDPVPRAIERRGNLRAWAARWTTSPGAGRSSGRPGSRPPPPPTAAGWRRPSAGAPRRLRGAECAPCLRSRQRSSSRVRHRTIWPEALQALKKPLGPVLGIEAERAGVAAHDAFAQDAAGKQAKPLLLQRDQVPLADFGDRRDVFQRNAARQALLAQVFSKTPHRRPKNGSNAQERNYLHDKPGFGSGQRLKAWISAPGVPNREQEQ